MCTRARRASAARARARGHCARPRPKAWRARAARRRRRRGGARQRHTAPPPARSSPRGRPSPPSHFHLYEKPMPTSRTEPVCFPHDFYPACSIEKAVQNASKLWVGRDRVLHRRRRSGHLPTRARRHRRSERASRLSTVTRLRPSP